MTSSIGGSGGNSPISGSDDGDKKLPPPKGIVVTRSGAHSVSTGGKKQQNITGQKVSEVSDQGLKSSSASDSDSDSNVKFDFSTMQAHFEGKPIMGAPQPKGELPGSSMFTNPVTAKPSVGNKIKDAGKAVKDHFEQGMKNVNLCLNKVQEPLERGLKNIKDKMGSNLPDVTLAPDLKEKLSGFLGKIKAFLQKIKALLVKLGQKLSSCCKKQQVKDETGEAREQLGKVVQELSEVLGSRNMDRVPPEELIDLSESLEKASSQIREVTTEISM